MPGARDPCRPGRGGHALSENAPIEASDSVPQGNDRSHSRRERAGGFLLGRETELRAVEAVLAAAVDGPRALVIEGSAGIGKSSIWHQALELARKRGFRVLCCRPAGAEVQLAFAALGDLLEPVEQELLPQLPEPRRRALAVLLLHDEGPSLDRRVVGVAVLDVLRRLAEERPLLIGIDDLQWLDPPSAHALEFALRRLRSERLALVATERLGAGEQSPLKPDELIGHETRVRVSPLSLGGTHELLRARLGMTLRRPALIRVQEASGGNPFVALELGRELRRRAGEAQPDERLPLPTRLQELVAKRLAELPAPVRRVLLAAGALTRPTVEQLVLYEPEAESALRTAERAGVVEIEAGSVRFTHPLLALIPLDELDAAARRRLHARLAEIVESREERARHAALSVEHADAAVAAALEEAADGAAARGAPETAAELCSLAARITPAADDVRRGDRLLAAAEWYQRSGDLVSAAARAEAALAGGAGAGSRRARALSLLATVRADSEGLGEAVELYRRALREPGAPRELRAEIHQKLAWIRFGGGEAAPARRHARAAVRLADSADPAVESAALATAAMIEVARGSALPRELLERALALEVAARATRPSIWIETSARALEGVVLLWAGELEQAREPLERMHAAALEREDPWLLMHSLAYLSALETGLGWPRRGLEFAHSYLELASEPGQDAQRAGALWPTALAAAWLGEVEEARAAAGEALAIAERTGHRLFVIGSLVALGLLELSLADAAASAEALLRARELARASGIDAPGRFAILPNAVEALLEAGDAERAAALARELERSAARLARPWALALAQRCAGLVAAAAGEREQATASLSQALALHAEQPRPLERARTELALGSALRRAGRKRDARLAIEGAAEAFEAAGAALWAGRAQEELRRIGGRRAPAHDRLSATEERVAELVAAGRSNAEVARTLHLSPRTVEWNLSKVYRKLGVRSRSELAATLRRPAA